MTLVDVCKGCGTLFKEGEGHCRRCGAERGSGSREMELRDLCTSYTGHRPEGHRIHREVRPVFHPTWGEVQWYEDPRRGRRADREEE